MTFEELILQDGRSIEQLTDAELDAILEPTLKVRPPIEYERYTASLKAAKAEKKSKAKKKKKLSEAEKLSLLLKQSQAAIAEAQAKITK